MTSSTSPTPPTEAPVAYLGIDIAKSTFDVALLTQDARPKPKRFANSEEGFGQLKLWLRQQNVQIGHHHNVVGQLSSEDRLRTLHKSRADSLAI